MRAQLALELNPNLPPQQRELAEARERLLALDNGLAKWVDQVIQEPWVVDGDRGSKLSFKSFRVMASSKQISSLMDTEGNLATSWEGMAAQVEEFFMGCLGGSRSTP